MSKQLNSATDYALLIAGCLGVFALVIGVARKITNQIRPKEVQVQGPEKTTVTFPAELIIRSNTVKNTGQDIFHFENLEGDFVRGDDNLKLLWEFSESAPPNNLFSSTQKFDTGSLADGLYVKVTSVWLNKEEMAEFQRWKAHQLRTPNSESPTPNSEK